MPLQFVLSLLLMAGTSPLSVTDLTYPPRTVAGATVLATLEGTYSGDPKVQILFGEEPFLSSVRADLNDWQFPKSEGSYRVAVIVNFRTPNLFAVGQRDQSLESPESASHGSKLPFPTHVVEPSYPPNLRAAGSVVLRLELDEKGVIVKEETLKSLGDLTDSCRDAVHLWRFTPGMDDTGQPTESEVYAVFVFKEPVINP